MSKDVKCCWCPHSVRMHNPRRAEYTRTDSKMFWRTQKWVCSDEGCTCTYRQSNQVHKKDVPEDDR